MFGEEQCYIVLETENAGTDLEHAKVGALAAGGGGIALFLTVHYCVMSLPAVCLAVGCMVEVVVTVCDVTSCCVSCCGVHGRSGGDCV